MVVIALGIWLSDERSRLLDSSAFP